MVLVSAIHSVTRCYKPGLTWLERGQPGRDVIPSSDFQLLV